MSLWVQGLFIIGIYLAAVLVIGFYSWRVGTPNLRDFAIASGMLGPVVLTFTLAATAQSAFVFMGYAGWLHADGLGAMLDNFGILSVCVLLWFLGRRLWVLNRRFGYLSLVDLTGGFYRSNAVAGIVLFLSAVFTLPYVGIQLAGAGYLFDILTDGRIPFEWGALLLLVVVILYTYLGGIRAVAWTDTFQGVFMFVMFLVGGYFVVQNAFGGVGAAFRQAFAVDPALLTLPGPGGGLTPLVYTTLWIIFIFGIALAPHLVIRTMTARSMNVLKWSIIGASVYVVVMTVFTPIYAVAAHALYPALTRSDRVFPMLLLDHAPFILAGIVMAGALAAMMSTADSQCHAVSTMLTTEFYKKYVRKNATDQELFRIARWGIVILGALAYLILLWQPPFLVQLLFLSLGGIALLAPVTLGALYWRRASTAGALASLAGGLLVNALFEYWLPAPWGLHAGFIGLAAGGVLFVVVSLLTPPVDAEIVKTHQDEVHEIIGGAI